VVLEFLFWKGVLSARRRASDFARVYDLAERIIPAHVLARPAATEEEARRELLVMAAKYHGVGTLDDLADYHRLKLTPCKTTVRELVADGRLIEAQVEGWDKPAYLHPEARLARRVDACALLSPFDPVCWHRDRNERLFGFHYRIEIYTPEPKRRFGYYVLPVLWGDSLVGRIDLKADRANRALLVPGAFTEDGFADSVALADDVARELWAMAGWLGLERVVVAERGDLACPLRDAVAHYAHG
jgi:uncharacterized protein YcaQ